MKRFILLLLTLLLVCMAGCALAEEPIEYTCGDYKYILLEDGTAEITTYSGKAEELVIPETLDKYTVTSIGDYAFYYCFSLTSVTIPDSVTSIGYYAFLNCTSLTSVTIPRSVTNIGANPFGNCKKLQKIKVSPDNHALATINGVLFDKLEKKLVCYPRVFTDTSYVIPQGIRSIGDYAFLNCTSLTSITIPDSVTSIGDFAFFDCTSLTSVTIPGSVTSIGNNAFYRCSPQLTLTVPRGSYAAQYCKVNNLTYTYPDSLDWLNN